MEIRIIDFNSENYIQELNLRNKVLRLPLGLNLFDENLENEISDIHIGAFESEKLIGVLILTPISDEIIKMRQVGIDFAYQGMGIGTKMVAFSEKLALEKGYIKITMHARKTAVEFYKRLGYKTEGAVFEEVRVAHFNMYKYLDYKIVMVDLNNINKLSEILIEAAEWLISENIKNWDPNKLTADYLLQNNSIDEFFLCYKDGEAIGCMKLQARDDMFWPDDSVGESLYIHKLAVKRKFAGQGISTFMLDWAKLQAKEKGCKYLKLDCIANRTKLCKVYERQDFIKVGERLVFGKYPTAFFEYAIKEKAKGCNI